MMCYSRMSAVTVTVEQAEKRPPPLPPATATAAAAADAEPTREGTSAHSPFLLTPA